MSGQAVAQMPPPTPVVGTPSETPEASGTIETVAGSGDSGLLADNIGDDGLAADAKIYAPFDVFIDDNGNTFIADTNNNRIRKVDSSGVITTVAGSGPISFNSGSFSGDGGPATAATLNNPEGVYVDDTGNIFIADTGNHRVRKVETSGVITTFAGSGDAGTDFGDFSGDGGPAVQAQLGRPSDVYGDDAGNIYIADSVNHRVRKVDPSGVITTVAGSADSGLLAGGFSGDGGPATQAQLNLPKGIFVSGDGTIYIATTSDCRIRKVDTSGTITTIAGTGKNDKYTGEGGPATQAGFGSLHGVFVTDDGIVFFSDWIHSRVAKIDVNGIFTTVAGNGVVPADFFDSQFSGDGGPALEAQLDGPFGIHVDRNGDLFIADKNNNRIRRVRGVVGGTTEPEQPVVNEEGLRDLARTAWQGLASSAHHCNEFDYFPDGGMRSFYCHLLSFIDFSTLSNAIEVPVFVSGPHEGGQLVLNAPFSFGHYNPEFVTKIGNLLIPGSDDETFRDLTQPVYDNFIQDLARIYHVTYVKLGANPDYMNKEKQAFLDGVNQQTLSGFYYEKYFYFMNPNFIGNEDNSSFLSSNGSSGGWSGNVVKTAVAFWIRRSVGGTDDEFFASLQKLLQAYDQTFLDDNPFVSAPIVPEDPIEAADIDGDGVVGFSDFITFASSFGKSKDDADFNARIDLDGDGSIGFSDFLSFAQNFGKTVGS